MNSQELRSLQAPLKQKYRDYPDSALVTHKITGTTGKEISCITEISENAINGGLHPAAGGDGSFTCSADILLQALVTCTGVTLKAVTTIMDIEVRNGNITAEGEIDYRGTLGVSKEVPVGFKEIRLLIELDCDATDEQLQSIRKLTERYCVVYQTIISSTTVTTDLRKIR